MSGIKYLNGLGLVASTIRNIKPGTQYDKYFDKAAYNDKFLTHAGSSHRTIDFMADIIKSTLNDTKRIAPLLKAQTTSRTLSNIFHFVFDHIQYKPDDPRNEELRRPKRAWADRTSGVDCDCYSILIGSILSNLKIPFALRMVKINGKPRFQHVYVVVPKTGKRIELDTPGNYYTVDPVLDTYNEEHPFTEKYDRFMTPIKYLNGVPNSNLNGISGTDSLYYSDEVASTNYNPENTVFFDGIDYYEHAPINVSGLNGLNGLGSLGFLKKLWGGIKAVGKVVKKIGGKAVKKVVFKKDGTKRGLFKLLGKKNNIDASAPEMTNAQLTPITAQSAFAQQTYAAPMQMPTNNMSTTDMVALSKATNQGTTLNETLNLIKTILPDNNTVSQLVNANANNSNSLYENRLIAKDAAKAAEADITNNVLDQVYKINHWNPSGTGLNTAGFGNIDVKTLGMLAFGGIAVFMAIKANKSKAV